MIKYFSLRSIKIFDNDFFRIFNRIGFFWVLKFLGILLLNINYLLLNISNRLNIFFSVSNLSRNFYRNFVHDFFIVNNWLILNCLSIDRSGYFLFSDNWCLHDSLFDNRLGNNSLGNNWLSDHLSLNLRLTYNLLTLSNLRSWVKNFVS